MTIEELYKEHSMTVYKYLLSLTKNEDVAEELTQETFYQAIKSIDKFDKSCKVTTWLCAIAKNQLRSYGRKNPPMAELEESTAITKNVESQVLSDVSRIELLKKIHLIDEPFKEVIYLRVFGNLSFKEIGDVLDKTENWARVTYYRGKEKLKREIDRHEE